MKRLLLGSCIFLVACFSHDKPDPAPKVMSANELIAQAEDLYSQGELFDAVKLLEKVSVQDKELYAYAQELYELAAEELEALSQYWERRAEMMLHRGKPAQALEYQKIAKHYMHKPLPDVLEHFNAQLKTIEKKLSVHEQRMHEVMEQSRKLLSAGAPLAALHHLRNKHALEKPLDKKSQVVELDSLRFLASYRHKRSEIASVAKLDNTEKKDPSSNKPQPLRRRRAKMALVKAAQDIASNDDENSTSAISHDDKNNNVSDAQRKEIERRKKKIDAMLKAARSKLSAKDYFNAIILYNEILSIEPKQNDAINGLKKLEIYKTKIIQEYLANASKHVIRHELDHAVPYYRKILILEPSNTKALQGIEMYKNLQQIKKETQGN